MAYQTLYRTFRPKKFEDVSGQPQVTDVLTRQIEKGTPAHAYLFCGTRGTGKTTTARILANALNCKSPVNGSPCGKCDVCKSFEEDSFVDVLEIDAASNNGVDSIRDIREKASLLPVAGKYKVYIIDEVHMLSPGAFNALLKTLEEPPAHTVFILATTEFRKVPKTIVSRCQHYDFRRITDEDIIARLQFVADAIGIKAEPEALSMLASQSEGALRDALSLMDQCVAGSDRLTKEDVRQTLGISDNVILATMCDSIQTEDPSGVLECAAQLQDGGTTPAHVLADTIAELSRRLAACGTNLDRARSLLRSLEVLIGAQATLRYSPAPGAVLTAALVRAALSSTDTDTKNLELRIRALEDKVEQITSGGVPVKAQNAPAHSRGAVAPRRELDLTPNRPGAAPAGAASASGTDAEQKRRPASPQDKLRPLKSALASACSALGPQAGMIQSLDERQGEVVVLVRPEDEDMARLLADDIYKEDVAGAMRSVFGDPAPRLRVGVIGKDERKTDASAKKDEQGDFMEDLANLVGAENIEILGKY